MLFTGASRVHRAVNPQQFDASVAAATGVKVRSFDTRLAGKALARYLEKVAVRTPGPVLPMPGLWPREFDALVAEIRAAGAQPLFLFTPSMQGRRIPGFREVSGAVRPGAPLRSSPSQRWRVRVRTDLVAARFAEN